jgi:2-deoxy-D-gluconate 3-dehydrogenase
MLEAFSLTGRRAIVTGAGGGLGSAMAEALYEAGADVAILGRSENIDEAAAKIGSPDRPVYRVRADLLDREALTMAFEQAVSELGGVDILVSSHGVVNAGDSLDYGTEMWDLNVETNLTSVFLLCQLAGKHMIAQGHGKIINIASMLSFSGGFRAAAYAASKGGVAQLTKALANEWSSKGVNVNAIAPGYVRTNLNRHIWTDPVRTEQIMARIPVGRWGEPSDMKGPVVFLASAASDYLHGVILPVDGGWMAR